MATSDAGFAKAYLIIKNGKLRFESRLQEAVPATTQATMQEAPILFLVSFTKLIEESDWGAIIRQQAEIGAKMEAEQKEALLRQKEDYK